MSGEELEAMSWCGANLLGHKMKNLIKKLLRLGDNATMTGEVVIRAYRTGTNELLKEIKQKNLIMTGSNTGRDLLINWLLTWAYNNSAATGTPITPGVNYIAIGTGTATPVAGNTQLQTECNRAQISYAADLTNTQAQFQTLFPDGILTTGTVVTEVGSFIGGTASANTGYIFNRALLGTAYTKSAGTDTTIQITITFN